MASKPKSIFDVKKGSEVLKALIPVSRETHVAFETYVELIYRWQRVQNLVSQETLNDLWRRHIADSVQAFLMAPHARIWLDIGSGAGFPGLVTALLLQDKYQRRKESCIYPAAVAFRCKDIGENIGNDDTVHDNPSVDGDLPKNTTSGTWDGEVGIVHLIESNLRKAAFLREAIRRTGAPAVVHAERTEAVIAQFSGARMKIDAVSARGVAPLSRLVDLLGSLWGTGILGVFHKGARVEKELWAVRHRVDLDFELKTSVIDQNGVLVLVRSRSSEPLN